MFGEETKALEQENHQAVGSALGSRTQASATPRGTRLVAAGWLEAQLGMASEECPPAEQAGKSRQGLLPFPSEPVCVLKPWTGRAGAAPSCLLILPPAARDTYGKGTAFCNRMILCALAWLRVYTFGCCLGVIRICLDLKGVYLGCM